MVQEAVGTELVFLCRTHQKDEENPQACERADHLLCCVPSVLSRGRDSQDPSEDVQSGRSAGFFLSQGMGDSEALLLGSSRGHLFCTHLRFL